ncbi:MBL fold metallo-hydrolase [Arenibacter sp. 6A1]|uniref:MBL fold metallo-hydrolase n=1 Tax=Arenibacter sp. 6A1 TaxID=2720391 RepID=UPI0014450BDF|nr:MBL fold metallo-hydrolase [Arenibacter sp. 6A1]NKI26965.1 MBL fold metallo-hydrolase [Arenibacter sp. 6A1]
MIKVSEIAPDCYRISVFVKDFNLQFNHFLLLDDEPMLYHAGMRNMFPVVLEAVRKIIDPSKLMWIGFSHFEVDECGALNEWLQVAPHAKAVCSEAGAIVNMGDFAIRPAHAMSGNAILNTGKHKYRFIRTPHLPHGWDAGVLFEETNGTLLCSDLFHQNGNVADITDKDILEPHRKSMLEYEQGPLMEYTPYTHQTSKILYSLADLKPKTLATMHGSSFYGDCSQALRDLNGVMKDLWGDKSR